MYIFEASHKIFIDFFFSFSRRKSRRGSRPLRIDPGVPIMGFDHSDDAVFALRVLQSGTGVRKSCHLPFGEAVVGGCQRTR